MVSEVKCRVYLLEPKLRNGVDNGLATVRQNESKQNPRPWPNSRPFLLKTSFCGFCLYYYLTALIGWMDGRVGGWMEEWVGGWMDGQMDRQAFKKISHQLIQKEYSIYNPT